jgi:hypothetical protein
VTRILIGVRRLECAAWGLTAAVQRHCTGFNSGAAEKASNCTLLRGLRWPRGNCAVGASTSTKTPASFTLKRAFTRLLLSCEPPARPKVLFQNGRQPGSQSEKRYAEVARARYWLLSSPLKSERAARAPQRPRLVCWYQERSSRSRITFQSCVHRVMALSTGRDRLVPSVAFFPASPQGGSGSRLPLWLW